MKSVRTGRLIAAVAAAGIGIAGAVVAPAQAATRTTLVYGMVNAMTSLNSSTPDTNLVTNSLIGHLTGNGFWYYDEKKNIVPNTVFGSYKIVKDTPNDYRISATVAPGRVWSDGTPITGVDLLMSHVLSSNEYSKAAGLGDPADAEKLPAFDSLGYNGTYSENIVGDAVLSKDGMTVTLRFKQQMADWENYLPGPSAVHTLVHLANGKTGLQPAAANLKAKADFLKAYNAKDGGLLGKIAPIWSKSYNITTIDASTNPLLLVSNGGFLVKSAIDKQSVTMTRNPKYNSGPAFKGNLKQITLRFIENPTAAAQAMANGEIDMYDGALTADNVAQFKQIPTAKVVGAAQAVYEHVDLRVGAPAGEADYSGPFAFSNNAAKNAKAKDLRTAFLLAYPRDEIVEKLIKPVRENAGVMNSGWVLPDDGAYAQVVKANGSSRFTKGTQDERTAEALKLVQKHFPDASATNPVLKIKGLHSTSARRIQQAAIAKVALAKAGIDVEWTADPRWSLKLDDPSFDVAFYAWSQSSVTQTGSKAIFETGGSNNSQGYSNAAVDSLVLGLTKPMKRADVIKKYIEIEKLIMADAVSLTIFQWPSALPYNKALKNVKPASLSPNYLWNYWELGY